MHWQSQWHTILLHFVSATLPIRMEGGKIKLITEN